MKDVQGYVPTKAPGLVNMFGPSALMVLVVIGLVMSQPVWTQVMGWVLVAVYAYQILCMLGPVKVRVIKVSAGEKIDREQRVLFLTDMHFGPFTGVFLIMRLIWVLLDMKVDIIVLGGDFIDLKGWGLRVFKALLELLRAKFPEVPIVAIAGGHEVEEYDYIMECFRAHGVRFLDGEHYSTPGRLRIFGTKDTDHPKWGQTTESLRADIVEMIGEMGDGRWFSILVTHNPDDANPLENFDGKVNLILSGHTHTPKIQKYGDVIHVTSSGLGTASGFFGWLFPWLRLFRPEATLIYISPS